MIMNMITTMERINTTIRITIPTPMITGIPTTMTKTKKTMTIQTNMGIMTITTRIMEKTGMIIPIKNHQNRIDKAC